MKNRYQSRQLEEEKKDGLRKRSEEFMFLSVMLSFSLVAVYLVASVWGGCVL